MNLLRGQNPIAIVAASLAVALPLCLRAIELPEREWECSGLDDDHVSIEARDKSRQSSAIPADTAGDLTVPRTLGGCMVVSIGSQAFDGCTKLTSVTIPEGVTNIADKAFYGCSSLTNVVFPSTLKSIGAYAFVGCGQLKQVRIEVPRLTIDERAFRNCDGLETVRFRGDELIASTRVFFGCGGLLDVDFSVKQVALAEGSFSGGDDKGKFDLSSVSCGYCDHLTNVSIVATGSIEIGASAFYNSALQTATLTSGAGMNVGASAFYKCAALQTATLIAGEVMSVGASAFSLCTALRQASVVAPKTTTFGDSVFGHCSGLQTVELPVGLVGVPTNAFSYCSSLQSVSLSSNVAVIAYRAFDTCTSLKTIELSEGLRTIEAQSFFGCKVLERLQIPQSVSTLGDRAFESCEGLGEVVFPGVDTNLYAAATVGVGVRCFYQDYALTNVVLSGRTMSFGEKAFSGCKSLAQIDLPTNLVDIANSLFESCSALSAIDFPDALQTIGNSAFKGCTSLTGFLIPTNNNVQIGNKAFANTRYWNDWPDDSLVTNRIYILGFKGNPTEVTLPDGCRSITSGMFEGMTALTKIDIPPSLETVGSRAFAGSGLVQISFSGTQLTTLGISAFDGCSNLVQCTLSETLTVIPDEAFQNCTSLQTMDIPASVVSIGGSAFRNCTSLLTVTGGEGVLSVGDYAFAGCVNLLPFRFPQDVAYGEHVFQGVRWTENVLMPSVGTMAQEYPESYADIRSIIISSSQSNIVEGACAGCAALEWVEIPNGVKSIGARAFEGCTAMTSLALSPSVTSVGSNVVNGCTALVTLTTSGAIAFKTAFPELAGRLSDIRIAKGAVSLCDSALAGCTALTKIEIPWTVETIGASAFADCVNLSEDVWIPDLVTSIGDLAFANCVKLRKVRYLGDCPEVGSDVYQGTSRALTSYVLRETVGWEESATTDDDGTDDEEDEEEGDDLLSDDVDDEDDEEEAGADEGGGDPGAGASIDNGTARWPEGDNVRPLRYMGLASVDKVSFAYYNGTPDCLNRHFKPGCGAVIEEFPAEPEREGYEFLGWFTAAYGGVEAEPPLIVTGSMKIYAHWLRVGSEDDPREYPASWGDVTYDVGKAHVYDGYLLDGDKVAGTIQVKLNKGKYSKKTEETTVSATAKAMILGEGKSISFKGVAEGVDESGGSCDMVCTKRSDERELSVTFEPNEMSGSLDGYEVVAVRNMFGGKTDWDHRRSLAAQDDCAAAQVAVLKASGGSPLANGYTALSLKSGSKGKVKVSGSLPDGTKVSVSTQVLPRDDSSCEIPVVAPLYARKAGGFGFLVLISKEDGPFVSVVTNISDWVANPGKANAFIGSLAPAEGPGTGVGTISALAPGSVFFLEDSFDIRGVVIDDSLLPSGVPISASGSKWTLPKKDAGNPSGLKLTYTTKTGTFKGSFKVYAVTDAGKTKKYTANVTGAVLNGVGYGTATIKKVGSVPVIIQPE